ncbi:uncharacterized protein PITG_22851 [Phytophthora infestans T30-4]|uniref:Uncharacterized protein n=1 Tax=Phytophthora infestans (strain T30-4) TaxID=403677 RepID=D0NAB4_PHYIT|nr:uncharacterized protein PITG_22851 [Phytophthora infestans T30-4]EEY54772.1 conserved hypothetical protein [Phytophthora infestans T30-4]|eukprot:XP_002903717.1 conserved hypothetical protein [Phytophthora infestans T30-4]
MASSATRMPLPAATSCSARLFLRLADAVRPALIGTVWRSTAAGTAVTCSLGSAATASAGLSASSTASTLTACSLVTAGVSPPFSAASASPALSCRSISTTSSLPLAPTASLFPCTELPNVSHALTVRPSGLPLFPWTEPTISKPSSWRSVHRRLRLVFLLLARVRPLLISSCSASGCPSVANSRVPISTVAGHFPELLLTSLLELLVSWLPGASPLPLLLVVTCAGCWCCRCAGCCPFKSFSRVLHSRHQCPGLPQ